MIKTALYTLLSICLMLPVAAPCIAVEPATDATYFPRHVYPVLQAAQCNLCHNDNGVAAETDLEFPEDHADETQITALKTALEGDNIDEIKRISEELTQSSHKLAEAMYKQASEAGAGGPDAGAGPDPGAQAGGQTGGDEDVVDADFEEVKDDK